MSWHLTAFSLVILFPAACAVRPLDNSAEEDVPNLQLLQVEQGIYRAAVDADGGLEEVQSLPGNDPAGLKPSPLAFGESEAEDMTSMHYLLQTARDVMPLAAKLTDAQAGEELGLQLNLSLIKAPTPEPELRTAKAGLLSKSRPLSADALQKSNESIEVTAADAAPLGTKTLSNGGGMKATVKAASSSASEVADALRGRGVHPSPLVDAMVPLLIVGFLVLLLLLFMVGASKVGTWCFNLYRRSEESSLRKYVQGMRRSPGLEVVNQLVAGSVYDCAIMRPLTSRQLIRLEARVEEAASGFCLWTPLTQQACVRFTATVSRQMDGASAPVPMSYHCASIDFVISLLDAPHVRIEIEGKDLSTFDMSTGRMSAKRTFDSAARHWQEFAMTYQIGGKQQPPARFRSENAVLEFQETSIVLGTSITVIGELQRNSVGTLLLRPALDDASTSSASSNTEPWRTSWETPGTQQPSSWTSMGASSKPWLGKVWISDDPSLLGTSHKHVKYEPTGKSSKPSRDCSAQISDGFVHLISSSGQ